MVWGRFSIDIPLLTELFGQENSMIEKMKIVLLYGVRHVRIEDTPVTQPEPDQALIKMG